MRIILAATHMTSPAPAFQPIIILDEIRSAHNVGSIFRTADAAGVAHIYLVGYTPQPIDRFGRAVPEIAKTALGAETTVPWTYCADQEVAIATLHNKGIPLVAVEQTPHAQSIYTYAAALHTEGAFVFGNEVTGVSAPFLAAAEESVYIPMYGQKESLNVGVSVGITLFLMQYAGSGVAGG